MNIDITRLLYSSTNHAASDDCPDGLVDCSHYVTPLYSITEHGRALNSSEPYGLPDFMERLLKSMIPKTASIDEYERVIITFVILIQHLLRSVPEFNPDMSIEEFLSLAFPYDMVKGLEREFAATPYNVDGEDIQPHLINHPMFAQAIPLTTAVLEGFYQRQMFPYRNTSEDIKIVLEDELKSSRLHKADPDWLTSQEFHEDAFNNFDEFFDYGTDREEDEDE